MPNVSIPTGGLINKILHRTASFDIDLLNAMVGHLVTAAGIRIHLESSSSGENSYLTWSTAVAPLLGADNIKTFHLDDLKKTVAGHDFLFRLTNLDSDPRFPVVSLSPNPLQFSIFLPFDTSAAKLEGNSLGAPDIKLESFALQLDIAFDGTIKPTCTAQAFIPSLGMDVSGDIASGAESGIRGKIAQIPSLAPDQVRSGIQSFFVRLMRLGDSSTIESFGVSGRALVSNYRTALTKVVPAGH